MSVRPDREGAPDAESASRRRDARIARDAPSVCAALTRCPCDDHAVVGVDAGLSDLHGGASVARVRFACGRHAYYKPRDVAIDAAFHALCEELGAHGLTPRIRAPAVLVRERYGWSEAIDASPCRSDDEAAEYFLRAGVLLGVLAALDGVDAHAENVVAASGGPILVDAETLLHPCALVAGPDGALRDDPSVPPGPLSPKRTGLLPAPRRERGGWIDTSGLTGVVPDRARRAGPGRPRDASPDVVAHNRLLDESGRAVSPIRFAREIDEGFRRACALLAREGDALLEPGRALRELSVAPRRVVIHRSRDLAVVAGDGSGPGSADSLLARVAALGRAVRLEGAASAVDRRTARSLAAGEVPRFTLEPEGGAGTAGRAAAIERTRGRLARLDGPAIERAAGEIRVALAGLIVADGNQGGGIDTGR